MCQPWLCVADLWKSPRMELPPPLWVTCCRAGPTSWWKSLSSSPARISQAVNMAVGSRYVLSHHSITSVTPFQAFCRLILDPSSPKWTNSAHTAATLWSIAKEKRLIGTKVDPQIFLHVRLEISDYWVRDYWTFTLPLTWWHKLITASSWCFIIASLQLKTFRCIEIQNISLWVSVLRESWQFMTKMDLLSCEQVTKCKRRTMIWTISAHTAVLHMHTRSHARAHVYACYVQIVFVITETINSEMSLNLVMCVVSAWKFCDRRECWEGIKQARSTEINQDWVPKQKSPGERQYEDIWESQRQAETSFVDRMKTAKRCLHRQTCSTEPVPFRDFILNGIIKNWNV